MSQRDGSLAACDEGRPSRNGVSLPQRRGKGEYRRRHGGAAFPPRAECPSTGEALLSTAPVAYGDWPNCKLSCRPLKGILNTYPV